MINITNIEKEQYYSIEEVAKLLKVVYLTVYRWIQSKKLSAIKAGKQYRISKSDLDKFTNKHK
ncbi:MAG: helix-turn-helix domain-containing protein [Candidatus Shapirobacteria bacterium]|nr:helix-turn-helix domain-containing protein [Candidatus Shapirobacteria bacterium]